MKTHHNILHFTTSHHSISITHLTPYYTTLHDTHHTTSNNIKSHHTIFQHTRPNYTLTLPRTQTKLLSTISPYTKKNNTTLQHETSDTTPCHIKSHKPRRVHHTTSFTSPKPHNIPKESRIHVFMKFSCDS